MPVLMLSVCAAQQPKISTGAYGVSWEVLLDEALIYGEYASIAWQMERNHY